MQTTRRGKREDFSVTRALLRGYRELFLKACKEKVHLNSGEQQRQWGSKQLPEIAGRRGRRETPYPSEK